MRITRRFTKSGQDALNSVRYEKRTSRITNPDGSVVFEMNDAEIPAQWSQLATDIMVSKYFRKAGVPQTDPATGSPLRDAQGSVVTGPEKSAKQVVHRLAGCWRHWGEKYGYFDTSEDAQAFYDELAYMLLHQMCAPNSPQWFNTGLNFAYGITGPAQGHLYCDPRTGELLKSRDAYSHPQPHACQPFRAPVSTPGGPVPIGKIVTENLVGTEVYDGTHNGSGTTRVVAVKSNGRKPVLRVTLEGGATIEATGDHLVYALTSDGMTGRWVRVDSLERGMKLLRSVRDKDAEALDERSLGGVVVAHRTLIDIAVKRVEPIGEHQVYDIQTESGQYLSNGVVVHNCFIQSVKDDLVNDGGIMDLWTREARLFKYGSGTGTNFSSLRGENEPLSGGGKSSGLMSFLKIGDRAAGAIKSGGTTRRAAKMVCLDLEHPDVESFINWKVREELKVAAMVEGLKALPKEQQETARRLKLNLSYDFNGEAYQTVSGQNSNNSVRVPNRFFKALEEDGDWTLTYRSSGKPAKTVKARDLWEQIAYAAWRCADPGVQYDSTINEWHTCPKSGRINASNPCVTGDTRVLTPGGIWRRIDQMIHLPSRVVTNLGGQSIHVTDGAFPTGTQEVFELRTAGGYALKLTADHKVWTHNRGWVEAKDLETSDSVRLPSEPSCVTQTGEPQDPKFFQLLGLYLSDCNRDAGALRVDGCLSDPQQLESFGRYVADNWGERLYNDDYVNQAMVDGGDEDRATNASSTGNTATATLTNRRLLSRLRAFVRTEGGATARRLSDETFTVGLAAQKHILRALFTADATITNNTVELTSESRGLLEDVQLVLLGFGVQAALFEIDPDATLSVHGEGGAFAGGGLPDRQTADAGRGDDAADAEATGSRTGVTAAARGDATPRRHGLRIDPGSLRSFAKYVGLLPGRKLQQLANAVSFAIAKPQAEGNWDRVASLTPLGKRQVFDLTEPVTHSFVANGLTVHNCSEYMFLDDTACNLASLNVLSFFDPESRRFDLEGFKHGIRLWTIVLEISVLMASFPSENIARLSYKFRTLGLGYANLGAMLMQAGIPYDSDKGRAICGALTAILTGESYAASADMARELGAFPGYEENKAGMLRVIRNHRRAAYDVSHNPAARRSVGSYEKLEIEPVGITETEFADNDPMAPKAMLAVARECWDRALNLGEKHGYRNAQTTVIAPTGTIGLLMDCDTTGVEPDFALVKFKKLAGGGYFKIANQSLAPALRSLNYSDEQVHDVLRYVMGTLT
ncbi:MAG TPA: LAGLIDADG family homing endonuclease, partial [Tepidisphaeraceae bacterium]|nr:LAGLIDADG family homing endonuclease [Tepidisphaeraceae bacterium]